MAIKGRQIGLYQGMFLSLVLHAFCVGCVLFFVTLTAQHPETVRVVLTLNPPGGGGGGGGDNRLPAGEAKKSQNPPRQETLPKRTFSRPLRLPKPPPATEKAPREETTDAAPLVARSPIVPAAPIQATGSEVREETAASATAGDGGEGGGSGGGRGIGTGTGVGSGIGSGHGSGAGSGVGNREGPGKGREFLENLRNRYLREHFAYIRDLILKNLTYPSVARKNGWQGKLRIAFIIRENGRVESIRIIESSGYGVLDRNVVETIREVQPFPKPPVRAELVIPVAYVLNS